MVSTFAGISTALSALSAQRAGLDLTGQNIANVNTEGYSRQRLDLKSVDGSVAALFSTGPSGSGGVAIADVARLRDAFLDARDRVAHSQSAYLTDQQGVYARLEQITGEPSDTGLQSQLAGLWSAWHAVANNPGNLAGRTQLLEQASTVAGTLNRAHDAVASQWSTSRDQLDVLTNDINSTARSIAGLNRDIVAAEASGQPANQLADQRDGLVLHLADLTGATAARRVDGSVDVSLGGSSLVSGASARALTVTGSRNMAGASTDPVTVAWADSSAAAAVPSGQVASVLQALGTTLPAHSAELDQVAASLASTVNTQHAAGYDLSGAAGGPFFAGTTAASIAVAITDPAAVAAAGTPGGNLDGGNATALAALATVAGGPDVSYRQLVSQLGAAAQTVNQRTAMQTASTNAADAAVTAVSGVSLDEELTNMLTYQRAYQAASKLMTILDSALDTLINHTGIQ